MAITKTINYILIVSILTHLVAQAGTSDRLLLGEALEIGNSKQSPNGFFQLILQKDGNLCIYDQRNPIKPKFVWCSMVLGADIARIRFDGALELIKVCPAGDERLLAVTAVADGAESLRLTDSGNMAIISKSNSVLWINNKNKFELNAASCEYDPILHPKVSERGTKLQKPPAQFGTYYKKYLTVEGLHILGTASTSDDAMLIVEKQINAMMSSLRNPENKKALLDYKIIVMSQYDRPTEMPFLDLIGKNSLRQVEFNYRAFSAGPVTLLSEEMICKTGVASRITENDDKYRGLDLVVHEFAHTIDHALKLGNLYNPLIKSSEYNKSDLPNVEFFAHAVQYWFSQVYTAFPASNRQTLTKRDLMKKYPGIYNLLNDIFDDNDKYIINCNDDFH